MKKQCIRYFMTALGCLLMALAINAFFVQHHFLSGGISGVAIILYYLTGWPPGITSLVFNIPLFWIAWKYMSRQFFINSVIGTVLFSLALDGTAFVQAYVTIPDKLLCSIAGAPWAVWAAPWCTGPKPPPEAWISWAFSPGSTTTFP